MNGLKLFLTTKIEDHGIIAGIGDFFLTPARYLWNGKNVRILVTPPTKDKDGRILVNGDTEMHHVKSFHKDGSSHVSKTTPFMKSSSTHFLKTTFAIIALVPGLALGSIFKGISFAYDNIRASLSETATDYYGLLQHHFTLRKYRPVGDPKTPLNKEAIIDAFDKRKTIFQKTENLIVYGQNAEFDKDPGFLNYGAKKVILVGIKLAPNFNFEEQGHLKVSYNKNIKSVINAINHKSQEKETIQVYCISHL